MRNTKYRITDTSEIYKIIKTGKVCRLGLCNDNIPYVVPLNYGYKDNALYFHCAHEGMKIDFMKKNNTVCFEIEGSVNISEKEDACNWTTKYCSVIGWGKAEFISDIKNKVGALNIIMNQYSKKSSWKYEDKALKNVCIFKINIDKVSGKSIK
jgi:nitroimidazol reductase NimA-like FMN-containing flavoprotein (pyridoxamine 5'-phosphate oxidase superfamily)